MNVSRRWFIGGSASLGALQGCRVFTDTFGLNRSGTPELRFGAISDVHIINQNVDRGTGGSARTFEHALRWYDAQGVDAVLIAGDIVDVGLVSEMQVVADTWYKVFPNDRSTIDGRKVEKLFIYGNHDWEGHRYGYTVYGMPSKKLRDDWISDFGTKKTWERMFHEEYAPINHKTVKGYDFIGTQWDGNAGVTWSEMPAMPAYFAENGKKLDPSKPFFYYQHPHPRGTCHGPKAWGQDNGKSTQTLSKYPNAIAFSGHSHHSLVDERAIWQGSFTSLGTGSLRYFGGPWGDFPEGFENGGGGPDQAGKSMPVIRKTNARNGLLVSVFDDSVSFRRHDFYNDDDLGPDWVMPLPSAESMPFASASRVASSPSVEFVQGAKVSVRKSKALNRKGMGVELKKESERKNYMKDALVVKFPAARQTFEKRAFRYDVLVESKTGDKSKLKRVISEDCHRPVKCAVKDYTIAFFLDELKDFGEVRVKVTPYNAFGKAGRALESVFVKV